MSFQSSCLLSIFKERMESFGKVRREKLKEFWTTVRSNSFMYDLLKLPNQILLYLRKSLSTILANSKFSLCTLQLFHSSSRGKKKFFHVTFMDPFDKQELIHLLQCQFSSYYTSTLDTLIAKILHKSCSIFTWQKVPTGERQIVQQGDHCLYRRYS